MLHARRCGRVSTPSYALPRTHSSTHLSRSKDLNWSRLRPTSSPSHPSIRRSLLTPVPTPYSKPIAPSQITASAAQPLPSRLLIENASDQNPAVPLASCPRRFRCRLATNRNLPRSPAQFPCCRAYKFRYQPHLKDASRRSLLASSNLAQSNSDDVGDRSFERTNPSHLESTAPP